MDGIHTHQSIKREGKSGFLYTDAYIFSYRCCAWIFAVKLLTVRAAWLSLIPLGSALALTMLKTDSAAGRDTAQSTGRDAAKDTVLKKQPAAVSMKA